MSQSKWDAEKMLDVYVYDYFVKRNLHATAQKFLAERKISTHPIAIDAPGGFLFEWWSVFWDIYMARVHEKCSNTATSYAEGQNQNQFGFNHWLKSWMQSYHPSSQLQLQQQLMPQAQPTTSVYDLESRILRTLLQKQSLGFGIDQMNNTGDVLANVWPTARIGYPVLPCGNVDVPLQQQEYPQSSLLNHQYRNSSIPILCPNRVISSGGPNADGSWPMTFKENYQALQKEASQKRKRPDSASFPAKHLRSADAFGLFPLISSTPPTMMLDDNISVPSLPQIGHSSLPLPIPGSDAAGPVFSATNRLAQMNVVLDASLADKNESISCYEDVATREMVISKGFTLTEFQSLPTSPNDVEFCHFSYDGKLLATGGHDKTATFWCTRSLRLKSKLEEHSHSITDARFSPRMPRFATSSADKTVKVWDADNPDYSLRTFTGHSFAAMSLDFHPWKDDLICSCDNNIEIRYWSIKSGRCVGIIKGGSSLMRFQPRAGRFLAAAAKNVVSILDVETQVCRMKLQGHEGTVNTICWDSTGEHLASVSDDLVKVWKIGSSGNAECVNELISAGNKSHACIFHPFHPSAAIIGCSENLELWDIAENKKVMLHAHNKPISCLAASSVNGLIASASRDKCIKIWK